MRLIDYVLMFGSLIVFAATMLTLFLTMKDLLSDSATILKEIRQRLEAVDALSRRLNENLDQIDGGADRGHR